VYRDRAERRETLAQSPRIHESTIADRPAEGILLSAGLDTSAIAALAVANGVRPHAVTVCWDTTAPDYAFAIELAALLGLQHEVVWANSAVLLAAMPAVIGILRSFDPMELRNSAVQYLGLRALSEAGARSAWVGDGADEIFAGYSYMTAMPPEALAAYTSELASFMRFSAVQLGLALGISVLSPYLEPPVVDFAVRLDPSEKVVERVGERHGKWVLRRAVEDLLPGRFVWRTKTAAEHGSGSTRLQTAVLDRITEKEFDDVRARGQAQDGVRMRDREQAFYYRLYRQQFPPPREESGEPRCGDCQAPLADPRSRYCGRCGAYPVNTAA
jgi:asparagine synthase (glutamine-hydrolysing)